MIIRTGYREPTSTRTYQYTGKEPFYRANDKEQAYWMLAVRINETFGDEGATVADIYHDVTGRMGLTVHDTQELVKGSKQAGYLK